MTVRTEVATTTLTEEEWGRVALVAEKLGVRFHDALRQVVLIGLDMEDKERLPENLVNDVSIDELPIHGMTRHFLKEGGVTMCSQVLFLLDRLETLDEVPYIGEGRVKEIMRALGRPPKKYADQFG